MQKKLFSCFWSNKAVFGFLQSSKILNFGSIKVNLGINLEPNILKWPTKQNSRNFCTDFQRKLRNACTECFFPTSFNFYFALLNAFFNNLKDVFNLISNFQKNFTCDHFL